MSLTPEIVKDLKARATELEDEIEAFKLKACYYERFMGLPLGKLTPKRFAGASRIDGSKRKESYAAYLSEKDAEIFEWPTEPGPRRAYVILTLMKTLLKIQDLHSSHFESRFSYRVEEEYEALLRYVSLAGIEEAAALYNDGLHIDLDERRKNLIAALSTYGTLEELEETLEIEKLLAEA